LLDKKVAYIYEYILCSLMMFLDLVAVD